MKTFHFSLFILCVLCSNSKLYAQQIIEFSSDSWNLQGGAISELDSKIVYSGGTAEFIDDNFRNGIIKADIRIKDTRSYPGIIFRKNGSSNYDYIYFRPHRFSLYDDALQYAPSLNGEVCWQLYYGPGSTTSFSTNYDEWVSIKLEVLNSKAQFFVGDMKNPVLVIPELGSGNTSGSIAFLSEVDGTYFSNVSITKTDELVIETEAVETLDQDHFLKEWEISKALPASHFTSDSYPRFYDIFNAGWETAWSNNNGLLNISSHRSSSPEYNVVYARSVIVSDQNKTGKIAFGYSDEAKIFLNKKLIYSGNYAYQSRGNSFTGTIGLHDTLYLDLQKGLNEIFVISKETFGGWGLLFKSDTPATPVVKNYDLLKPVWNTRLSDISPESALIDKENKFIYVTNFDPLYYQSDKPSAFISKLTLKGELIDSLWIDGLESPTGLVRKGNSLYISDREDLVEVSISEATILNRYPYPPNTSFVNDVTIGPDNRVYMTNSDPSDNVSDILVLIDSDIEPWIDSDEFRSLNGIQIDGNKLLVGNSGKGKLQSIDLDTQEINTLAALGAGTVDGIKKDRAGNYLVSLWEGKLFKVSKKGEITELLDSTGRFNIADFEFDTESNTLLIPTFLDGQLRTFKFINE